MGQLQVGAMQRAIEIVGSIDGSKPGEQGRITVTGAFAEAVMRLILPSPAGYEKMGIHGQPVTIHRGSRLELDCDGFKLEGSEIRAFVNNAANDILKTGVSS